MVPPKGMMFKEIPSQAELNELLEYRDGELYWKKRPVEKFVSVRLANTFNTRFAGKRAGNLVHNTRNHRINWMVKINRVDFYLHRIVWSMLKGEIPQGMEIDHINGNTLDNRIENLRVATRSQNVRNSVGCSKLGLPKGVRINKRRFCARIMCDRKYYHLGSFKTIEEASNAYNEAAKRLHGEFARSGSLESNKGAAECIG
jgi:hypothetical protein